MSELAHAEASADAGLRARLAALDRPALERALDTDGLAVMPRLLNAQECAALSNLPAKSQIGSYPN